MSSYRTAEEAKSNHMRVMGEDLGRIYDALWQHVACVHGKWNEYLVLFGTKESRIGLLNKTAPAFFSLVQDSLWENVLLHIARLTDRPATAGRQNLSIQRLASLVDRPVVKELVEMKVQTALDASTFARDWRNRHLAHNDLDLKTSENAKPLEFASRQRVNEALHALSDVLNVIATEYLESTSFFETLDGDALGLLYVIDDGLQADQERRNRLEQGVFDPEIFKPRGL